MQIHADDDKFEVYLKQFRPRAPEPLPVMTRGRHARRALAVGSWAAAIVLTGVLLATSRTAKPPHSPARAGDRAAFRAADFQPLTIRTANELLDRAPSLQAAMNELLLDSEEKTIPKSQSAFAALSKENVNP